ncbi:MAG: DoxX family membrane protein [Robiginitomaculum sp.]|nr:DoxX family membrane protein [Robiginitomaculum sp.]
MNLNSSGTYLLLGRYLLGLYFLAPGVAKILAPDLQLALMHHHSIPYAGVLLYIAGIAQIAGAIALMSNRFVRITCLGFVIYILIINFALHDFWNYSGGFAVRELQSFIKNLGILAGILVLASVSVKRPLKLKTIFIADRNYSD